MELYEHKKDFTIKYCDSDFKDEMKLSVALALMEEVACSSADELGFGYAFVKPRGYAFMVTNVCMEFLKPVALGEIVQVITWPLPPTRVTFGREYQFLLQGEVAINASSRWCLVDMKEGKLLQSKVIDNQDYSTYNTTKVFENVVWKIPAFTPSEGELRYQMTVANSEYDHNMHVNNTRYADYCLNCFTIAELSEKKLKRFSITYAKQCKEGDVLRFYRKSLEDGGYLVQGFNAQDETVVQSAIYFQE
jgi:acyl-ACP thioesterase